VTKDKPFVLNLIPLPEGEFGPGEARDWMESRLPKLVSAAHDAPGKSRPGSADVLYFIKKDTATMATACSEAIASGKPVEFGRGLDALVALLPTAPPDLAARGYNALRKMVADAG